MSEQLTSNYIPAGEQHFGVYLKEVSEFENTERPHRKSWSEMIRAENGAVIHLLDNACGNGTRTIAAVQSLAQDGQQVILSLVDIQTDELSKARLKIMRLDEVKKLNTIAGSFETLPIINSHFNAIYSSNSLQWAEEPSEVLKESNRVLKKGGLLLLEGVSTVYNRACIGNIDMSFDDFLLLVDRGNTTDVLQIFHPRFNKTMCFFTIPGIQHLCESSGFEIIGEVLGKKNKSFPNDEYTDGKQMYYESASVIARKK
jgi:ubiquinone/menaquinone biosynthesis C-methylase UbiE